MIGGKAYDSELTFNEIDLMEHQYQSEEAIQKFVCDNTQASFQFKSSLKLPQHLTTIIGQQYRRVQNVMGFFSIHFDPEHPYVDHSKTPEDWKTDDGTHPKKLYFQNWQYNNVTRNFKGTIVFGKNNKYYGAAEYRYDLTFGEDFTEIVYGYRYSVDENNNII